MAKTDLADAFRHVLVRQQDWELLGSTWFFQHPSTGESQRFYVFDMFLPFGLRSSPALFNEFADGLHFAIQQKGVEALLHYLDDFFTCGPPDTDVCYSNLDNILQVSADLGFSINAQKTIHPTPVMEFLGIILDSIKMEARISEQRLRDTLVELEGWKHRRTASKRDLLSIVGKLSFISRVCKPGRTL
ncbi:uncharacterized protein LOC144453431 [Glandiceps talaboti]